MHKELAQPEKTSPPPHPLKQVTEKSNTSNFVSHQMVNAPTHFYKYSSVLSKLIQHAHFKMRNIRASSTYTNTSVMQQYISSIIIYHHNLKYTPALLFLPVVYHVIYGAPPIITTFQIGSSMHYNHKGLTSQTKSTRVVRE